MNNREDDDDNNDATNGYGRHGSDRCMLPSLPTFYQDVMTSGQ